MNRRYTREHYLDIIAKLRDSCPGIAITSDMIVGFPGETKADFEATLDLMRQVEFDGLFAFMYSDRPNVPPPAFRKNSGTGGPRAPSDPACVPGKLHILQKPGTGRVDPGDPDGGFQQKTGGRFRGGGFRQQWSGRTLGNKIVHFFCDAHLSGAGQMRPGQLARVRIEKALAHSLWGSLQRDPVTEGLD